MRDLFVQSAGILGIASAVVHGILAETTVFPRARIDPAWASSGLAMQFRGVGGCWRFANCSSLSGVGISPPVDNCGRCAGLRFRGHRQCLGNKRQALRMDDADGGLYTRCSRPLTRLIHDDRV